MSKIIEITSNIVIGYELNFQEYLVLHLLSTSDRTINELYNDINNLYNLPMEMLLVNKLIGSLMEKGYIMNVVVPTGIFKGDYYRLDTRSLTIFYDLQTIAREIERLLGTIRKTSIKPIKRLKNPKLLQN